MAIKPFFEGAESRFFDGAGMPVKPGIYEFRRSDGRKILYTLAFMDAEEGGIPRLKVVHASRMEDYPYPAHALKVLDGEWIRWLGEPGKDPSDGGVGGAGTTDTGAADAGSTDAAS
jgi:hypothetical protein